MAGEIIVDVQGFKMSNNRFVVKELAAITINKTPDQSSILYVKIFKPPCKWNHGSITYDNVEDVLNIIVRDYQCIYVKGCEKQKWVKSFCSTTKQVIDLESLGCPSINKLPNILKREQHQGSEHSDILYDDYHCAMENVQRLKIWFLENYLNPI
ncbi:hypothetical protein KQX54_011461 [Cotesia glomerata]|uniref:Uncharacterized protein n=1 Tax=Cotesia glomerata TaxID=32391 RepID=A0AAV7HWW6_COTGL|nr:hypothetical protein KQX54_011461 [Cotesia glomerata]